MPCKNHPYIEDNLTRCSRCAEAFCPDCIVEIGGLPYCLSCKTESMRDLRSGVPISELDMATIGRRFGAIFLDGLILTAPLILLVLLVFLPLGMVEPGDETIPPYLAIFGNIFVSLVAAFAYVVYEGLMLAAGGQTVGKKAMRIKVVSAEGGEISRGQAWGRAFSRQLLGLVPCLGLVDYLFAFGQERTCIHDMMAKTRVVNWR
ncbi:MAG TPA: RDD family protein [Thermoanaerobaculia bacterium]|nr:RDD family protein [Thermoanaerobaculia bacterium]